MNSLEEKNLEHKALEIRRSAITALYHADSGHPGSSLSWADIAVSLFFHEIDFEKGDRFILSKGHAVPTFYAVLAEKGDIKKEEFHNNLRRIGSPFQGHPVAGSLPFIDVSTGSLGQGLSIAMGMAQGKKLTKKNGRIYVLLGDGELQEGQNWEAFRYGGVAGLDNLTVIIDRNGHQNDAAVEETLPLGDLESQLRNLSWNAVNVNGHNMKELTDAYASAKLTKGKPSVIIANTVKGKGVKHIEENRKKHNGAMTMEEYADAMYCLGIDMPEVPFKAQAKPENKELGFGIRDAFGDALADAAKEYDNLVVVDCDLGSATRTNKFGEKSPERFLRVGIAEQHAVSFAAGLAKEGYRAIVSSFGAFLTQRAKDQIMNSVAYSNAGVILVGSHSGLAIGKDGATQMGIDDINSMRGIPGMEIYSPASPVEMKQVLEYLLKRNQYVYLRTSRRPVPTVHDESYVFNPERANIIRDCKNKKGISIFATGDMVYYALESAKTLEDLGIPSDVINISRIQPIDKETIIKYGSNRRGIFTVEDHGIIGGLGTVISEIAAENGLAKVCRHGIKGFGESGDPDDLYRKHKLDVPGIVDTVKEFYNKVSTSSSLL